MLARFVLGLLFALAGVLVWLSAQSAVHEIEALCALVVAAILIDGHYQMLATERLREAVLEVRDRLPPAK